MILIVFGLPGSGKSYFAEALATKLQATYINSDVVRKEMFPIPSFSPEEKDAVYLEMLHRAKQALDTVEVVVLDATFHARIHRELFNKELSGNVPCLFIELKASEPIIFERLTKGRNKSTGKFRLYNFIKMNWEPFTEEHLVLASTNRNLQEQFRLTEAYLNKRLAVNYIICDSESEGDS